MRTTDNTPQSKYDRLVAEWDRMYLRQATDTNIEICKRIRKQIQELITAHSDIVQVEMLDYPEVR